MSISKVVKSSSGKCSKSYPNGIRMVHIDFKRDSLV